MTDSIPHQQADRTQLQQIIAGLTEGVIIIDPDQTIAWANDTALKMHGVESMQDLGSTVDEYRRRFELRYRNRHRVPDGEYPMDRVVSGEAFSEVVAVSNIWVNGEPAEPDAPVQDDDEVAVIPPVSGG